MMYLAPKHWSPRYDNSFFTIQIGGKQKLTTAPLTLDPDIHGKNDHPAFYYEVRIMRAQDTISFYRRYSHFYWMYKELTNSPPKEKETNVSGPIRMPPGTHLFQPHSEAFLEERMEQLKEFVNDIMERPGYACHPAVVKFFALHEFIDES